MYRKLHCPMQVAIQGLQTKTERGTRPAFSTPSFPSIGTVPAAGRPARRLICGMVHGMASVKITITLPNRQLAEIRRRVAARESASVSGYIQQAVQKSLENAAEFRAIVDEALKETGGPLTPRERAWARRMLSPRKRGARPWKAA